LLLQYVCHSVDCQLYCQFGSADSTVLYTDCVVAFSFHYSLYHLTCCYSMSVIQLTVTGLTLDIIYQLIRKNYRALL
jgi:hypothetical protein